MLGAAAERGPFARCGPLPQIPTSASGEGKSAAEAWESRTQQRVEMDSERERARRLADFSHRMVDVFEDMAQLSQRWGLDFDLEAMRDSVIDAAARWGSDLALDPTEVGEIVSEWSEQMGWNDSLVEHFGTEAVRGSIALETTGQSQRLSGKEGLDPLERFAGGPIGDVLEPVARACEGVFEAGACVAGGAALGAAVVGTGGAAPPALLGGTSAGLSVLGEATEPGPCRGFRTAVAGAVGGLGVATGGITQVAGSRALGAGQDFLAKVARDVGSFVGLGSLTSLALEPSCARG